METVLEVFLKTWEETYQVKAEAGLEERFKRILKAAHDQTGRRCVVLVDEYDNPFLETMGNRDLLEHNKAVFKGFFGTLKNEDAHIQFAFITGVTKFSKGSIFSDLNQLEDLSFDNDYSGICGITEEEMLKNFEPEIERMANERSLTRNGCLAKLRKTYDGYRFSADGVRVYNPFSLLTALKKRRFGSFWYMTGTPTILVRRLKKMDFDIRQLSDRTLESTEALLSDCRTENPDPVPLLYQTGYLTIVDYSDHDVFTLGLPNDEVRYAFLQSLMPEYVSKYGSGSGKDIFTLKRHIQNGNLEGIKNVFTALFASITYTTNDTPFEHYFQAVFYLTLTLLGQYVHCEQHTSTGRIDCTVETPKYVYIFEFKRDGSADAAIAQINEMHYADQYAADERKLYKIGVNFDSKTRQMSEWKVEER
ncbi:MAG: AAA family ATPase [Clostridia bacterium]|nr:AAA family ATPase [Clostridia bacterium]